MFAAVAEFDDFTRSHWNVYRYIDFSGYFRPAADQMYKNNIVVWFTLYYCYHDKTFLKS